jgi:hypothetical protein
VTVGDGSGSGAVLSPGYQHANKLGALTVQSTLTLNSDFNELDDAERKHFYRCQQCGEMVDMRQSDDVLFHEDHTQRPGIHYGGSQRLDGSRKD